MRRAVCLFVVAFEQSHKIEGVSEPLLLTVPRKSGKNGIISGKVETSESDFTAMLRELAEEIGWKPKKGAIFLASPIVVVCKHDSTGEEFQCQYYMVRDSDLEEDPKANPEFQGNWMKVQDYLGQSPWKEQDLSSFAILMARFTESVISESRPPVHCLH